MSRYRFHFVNELTESTQSFGGMLNFDLLTLVSVRYVLYGRYTTVPYLPLVTGTFNADPETDRLHFDADPGLAPNSVVDPDPDWLINSLF